ncbi:GNAT family N-acetyltransferase [Chlorobaculum limnaeum]|uniref:GNAT family N-acetyltransferase n=1 Tax=Chlorobaculum limnaeum TaxID=274537 RepID=UPI00147212A3|nr:GNAT family N-acetyltransferase [Chlorobaculum limnaeum]
MDDFDCNISLIKNEHIESIVKVHQASFPGYFLSFLGPKFLSLFYKAISSSPEGISFVYINDIGSPIGFVAGTTNPRGFYSRLLKQKWLSFALAAIPAILRKPSVFLRVLRGVLHPSGNPKGKNVAGIYSIGVLPEYQGIGAGKKLVKVFFENAKQRGCNRVFLTTDQDNNDAVNAFYLKSGFNIERQYITPEGRRMNEYWITLL